jgi:hypothetical protein
MKGGIYSFAKTPLKAAQAPLARARRSQVGWWRREVMLILGLGVG